MDMARINPEGIRRYLKGYSGGGTVSIPVKDVRDQPTIQTGIPVDKQPHFPPVVLGHAQGGAIRSTIGLIPGKVNPNVADDVTIDAKKGEYVLPVEVVGAMGGPDAIDAMVKNIKTKMGMSAEVGPKMRNEPDAHGRMNARGMRGFARGGAVKDPNSDESIINNINDNRVVADVNAPRQMYDGNGPLSRGVRYITGNTAPAAGVPTAYDRAMEVAGKVGGVIKSWGRAAQPELAGADSDFTNKGGVFNTNIAQGFKNWDARQRNPDAITATHSNLNLPSDFTQATPPVVAIPPTTPERAPMTSAQMLAVTPLPRGFGQQRVEPTTTPAQDDTSRLAAREAQYASTARDSADTEVRGAFGAKALASERKVTSDATLQDKVDQATRDLAWLSTLGPGGDGKTTAAGQKMILDSLLAQQGRGMKEAEIASGIEKENIKGGFGLKEQALRNEGVVAQENVRGGFTSKSRELDPSQVAENNARAALLTKQAEGTLSKKEQLELTAANKQAEIQQNQKKLGAEAYTKTFAETGDPLKAADAQMAVEAALSRDTFIPGIQAQKGTFRFGFGKPKVDATPGKVVKNGTVDTAVAQKLMARYGNDPVKARAAYAAGER